MDETWRAFCFGAIFGGGIVIGTSFSLDTHTKLYKAGQIDALSGKVLFELKQQPDNTVIWVRKEDVK
jgi:hypothetical protein